MESIILSVKPFTKCYKCKKVNDLFLEKDVYQILERLHLQVGSETLHGRREELSYYLDTCACEK